METNRDYLNSLSNEDFAKWLFDRLEIEDNSGRYPLVRLDGIHYITISYIDPCMGFVKWLEQDRKETSNVKGGKSNEI